MSDSVAVDLDLMHLVAIAPDESLPPDRMRAVLDRELARLAVAMHKHFATEEKVARRTGDHEALAEEHQRLSERLRQMRLVINTTPVSETKSALIELLDMLGEHERSEVAASPAPDSSR